MLLLLVSDPSSLFSSIYKKCFLLVTVYDSIVTYWTNLSFILNNISLTVMKVALTTIMYRCFGQWILKNWISNFGFYRFAFFKNESLMEAISFLIYAQMLLCKWKEARSSSPDMKTDGLNNWRLWKRMHDLNECRRWWTNLMWLSVVSCWVTANYTSLSFTGMCG